MKLNNQMKACVFAILCLSLPAALKADDSSYSTGGTASSTTTSSQKSTAAGDTENINNNIPSSAGADNTAANSGSSMNQNNGTHDAMDNGRSDNNKWSADKTSANRMASVSTEVTDNNKASTIIGMEVRNNSDEKLGRIKDLVLDLQSGKVSYAVLDGGSVFKSKLFAIPLSAFSTSADSRYLILNADKSKIETAQGFDKTAWPSVNNPDWGASSFLQDNPANSSNNGWEPEHRINNTKADGMGHLNAPTASPTSPNQ